MKRVILFIAAAIVSVATLQAQEITPETKTRFLPMRQRVDRNVGDNKFVLKGEYMLGLTASYGNLKSQDADIMLLLDNLNIGLRSATVKPLPLMSRRILM